MNRGRSRCSLRLAACAAGLLAAGATRAANEIQPLEPFPDEREAMAAQAHADTPANRAALAKIRFTHAGELVDEFERTSDPGKLVWALDYAESATELDPKTAAHWLLAGYLYGRVPNSKEAAERAETALKQALAIQPESAEASSLLGMLYVRTARPADAMDPLETAIKRRGEAADPVVYSALCQAYVFARQGARGERFLRAQIKTQARPHVAKIALAAMWRQTGQPDKATAMLQEVADDPKASDENREGARLLLKER